MSSSTFAEKYPLTEQSFTLRNPSFKRWQYTLSGWLTLIRTAATEEGREMERQIHDRMWEDLDYSNKIRAEFEKWLSEGEKWEEEEDLLAIEDENEWMGGPTSNIEEDKREEPINQELSDYLNYAPREGVSSKEKKKYKLGVEEEEDNIRKSHRKTIRNQGKYKSRGKEKNREP